MNGYDAEIFVCEGVSIKDALNLNFLFENVVSRLIGDRLKNDSSFYNFSERFRALSRKSFKLEASKCVACKNVKCC